MARKNLIYSYPFFNAQVLAVTTTSGSSKVDQLDVASIDLRWSASTFVGTATVEVKNGDNGAWRALTFDSTIDITGASGAHEIVLLTMPFTDLRLTITRTSGSGTITAILTAKSTGA